MGKTVYTLKKKKDTEEYHLFEAVMSSNNSECTPNQKSICEKMDKNESSGNYFYCEDENNARKKCAALGRPACGICVSHLYSSY